MSTALDLKREAKLTRVFELLASGEAQSISDACELANVPRSTLYAWLKTGDFDELLSQMKQANIAETVSRFTDALPSLLERVLSDALNESEGLSARDRDQAARTALLIYDKLTGSVSQPATGESAADWLSRHAGKFQPIQIVGPTIHITGADDPEVESEE